MKIEISPGEFFDRLTILQLKEEHIKDKAAQREIRKELRALEILDRNLTTVNVALSFKVESRIKDLQDLNRTLWNIEEKLRWHEANEDFGESFVELARAVYRTNDERCAVKNQINELLGSKSREVKSY